MRRLRQRLPWAMHPRTAQSVFSAAANEVLLSQGHGYRLARDDGYADG
jgi:hypothetical protein